MMKTRTNPKKERSARRPRARRGYITRKLKDGTEQKLLAHETHDPHQQYQLLLEYEGGIEPKHVSRSKYSPHQGKQEMQRRRERNDRASL